MKRIVIFSLVTLLVLISLATFFILNRSSSGLTSKEREQALTNILGRPVVLQEKYVPTGYILHKGKYDSFLYPAAAKIYTPMVDGVPVKSQDLENFMFDLDNPKVYIVTEVIQATSSELNVSDYPSVRLRQSAANGYRQSTISANGQTGLSFDKTGDTGFEKTGFFMVNGKIYTFSVQSTDPKSAKDVFSKMITSLNFVD